MQDRDRDEKKEAIMLILNTILIHTASLALMHWKSNANACVDPEKSDICDILYKVGLCSSTILSASVSVKYGNARLIPVNRADSIFAFTAT